MLQTCFELHVGTVSYVLPARQHAWPAGIGQRHYETTVLVSHAPGAGRCDIRCIADPGIQAASQSLVNL